MIIKISERSNYERTINAFDKSINAIKDCIGMVNSLNQLGAIIDDNTLKESKDIYSKIVNLAFKLEDALESLNKNE